MLCRLNALSSLGEDFIQPLQRQKMSVHSADVWRNIRHGLELSIHVEAGVAEEEEKEEVEGNFVPSHNSKNQ